MQMRDIQQAAGNPRRDGRDLPPNLHSVNASLKLSVHNELREVLGVTYF